MSKYNSRKAEVNGIKFDSQREAKRFNELLLLEKAGEIKDLRLQPEFTLQEAFKTAKGEAVRAIRYRADFQYLRRVDGPDGEHWESVVEDTKGFRTKDYEIKRKLMLGRGIKVVEI